MKPSVESIVLNHFPSKENDSMASPTKKKGKKIEEEEKFVEGIDRAFILLIHIDKSF